MTGIPYFATSAKTMTQLVVGHSHVVVEIAHVFCFLLCCCRVLFQCSSSLLQPLTSCAWDLRTWIVHPRTRSWLGACLVRLATVLRGLAQPLILAAMVRILSVAEAPMPPQSSHAARYPGGRAGLPSCAETAKFASLSTFPL